MDEGIPIPVRTLLAERIGSVAQLETLLLLHALAVPAADSSPVDRGSTDAGARDASAVAGALRIGAPSATEILEELARAFLVVVLEASSSPSGTPLYRFPIEDLNLRSTVEQLRATYAERRVTVISLIFSKPLPSGTTDSPAMRSFSNAFRLRPDKENPAHG